MRSDRKLLLIAVLFLFAQIIWLMSELNLIHLPWIAKFQKSDRHRIIGTIISTQNNTRQRAESEIIWQNGVENENVHTFDALLTLKNSAMRIKLNNGSELNLSENTLVYIEPLDDQTKDQRIRIRFAHGSLRSKLSDLDNRLDAQSWEMNAESGSEIQIKALDSGQIELDVTKGAATATNQGQVIQIHGGETVELGKNQLTQRRQISPTLKWVENREKVRVYSHSFPSEGALHWQGKAHILEIQQDGHPLKTLPLTNSQNEVSIALEEGSYEARLLGDDGQTSWLNLEMWRAPIIHLMSPLPRDRYGESEKFEYLWLMPKNIKSSRWQLSDESKFKNLINSYTTNQTELFNTDLNPIVKTGHYHWRVLGYDSEGFGIPAPYSNPIHIVPDPLEAPLLNIPVIRKPAEKPDGVLLNKRFQDLAILVRLLEDSAQAQEIKNFDAKKNTLLLSWQPVTGAEGYVLEISENPDFRTLLVEKKMNATHFQWKNVEIPKGVFYWRVASDSPRRMGRFSPVAAVHLEDLEKGLKIPGVEIVVRENPPPQPITVTQAPITTPETVPATVPSPEAPIVPMVATEKWIRPPEKFATLDLSFELTNWQDSAGTTYTLAGPTGKIFFDDEKTYSENYIVGLLADLQYTTWTNTSSGSVANGTKISELRDRIWGTIGSVSSRWIFAIGESTTGLVSRTGLETATLTPSTMLSVAGLYHFNDVKKWQGLAGISASANSGLNEVALILHAHKKVSEYRNLPVIAGPEIEVSQFGGNQATGTRFMFGYNIGFSW